MTIEQEEASRKGKGTRYKQGRAGGAEATQPEIRTDEGGVRRKGPWGVALRFETRRQSGCYAAVAVKGGSAGVTPANRHANVDKREASKDKLWAGK